MADQKELERQWEQAQAPFLGLSGEAAFNLAANISSWVVGTLSADFAEADRRADQLADAIKRSVRMNCEQLGTNRNFNAPAPGTSRKQ